MNKKYNREYKLLLRPLCSDLQDLFRKEEVILAGGAITSLFSNSTINDYDLFFKTEKNRDKVLEYFLDENNGLELIYDSDNAKTFKTGKLTIQLICKKDSIFKDTKLYLFQTFDFTVCMGAYLFKEQYFLLHEDFLEHLSKRILKYNILCTSPLHSMWRLHKYVARGFTIESPEILKMALHFAEIYKNINTLQELEPYLNGFSNKEYHGLKEYIFSNGSEKPEYLLEQIDNFNIIDSFKESTCDY